jgi:hypothetical protein
VSDISVVSFGVADVVFFLAQLNRVGTTARWRASSTAVALYAATLIFLPQAWPAALIAAAVLFVALYYKWYSEVFWDAQEREMAGLEPLIKVRFQLAALSWSPTFWVRYRRRMFRNEWSRRELLAKSVAVPERLRDRAPEA